MTCASKFLWDSSEKKARSAASRRNFPTRWEVVFRQKETAKIGGTREERDNELLAKREQLCRQAEAEERQRISNETKECTFKPVPSAILSFSFPHPARPSSGLLYGEKYVCEFL